MIEEALAKALFRKCTGCGVPTERIDACCHMTCSHCRAEFSWVCGADYHLCRRDHPCLNGSIYLHSMPQLAAILDQRGLPRSDENGSDLFLDPCFNTSCMPILCLTLFELQIRPQGLGLQFCCKPFEREVQFGYCSHL